MKISDWFTLLSDVMEIAMAAEGYGVHLDLFNFGVMLGHVTKVATQLWMKGII